LTFPYIYVHRSSYYHFYQMNSLRQELMLAAAIETLQEGENLLAPTDLEREFEDHLKVTDALTFMVGGFLFPSLYLFSNAFEHSSI